MRVIHLKPQARLVRCLGVRDAVEDVDRAVEGGEALHFATASLNDGRRHC
jgi:hypothetical protein